MAEAFKKSDVEILVATMHRDTLDFLVPMFPFQPFYNYNILVINQTSGHKLLTSVHPSVRVINSFEVGLSKSRNLALENTTGKLAMLTDDDVAFTENFDVKITDGFNCFPQMALLRFKAATFEGNPFQKYALSAKNSLNVIDRLLVMSIEIGLNMQLIRESGVMFDTNFGLGSTFPLSEEPVFASDLYNAGYKMGYIPQVIATHKALLDSVVMPLEESYRIKGAFFKRVFKSKYALWLGIQLLHHLKHNEIKPKQLLSFIKYAQRGRQQYLQISK